jgi:hypothetical protein
MERESEENERKEERKVRKQMDRQTNQEIPTYDIKWMSRISAGHCFSLMERNFYLGCSDLKLARKVWKYDWLSASINNYTLEFISTKIALCQIYVLQVLIVYQQIASHLCTLRSNRETW